MNLPFEIYCVGGAVRDQLLGLSVRDRDWVVVGGTPEAMVARGFKPVGSDFPVFCIRKHTKNMRWRELSAKLLPVTKASIFTPRQR